MHLPRGKEGAEVGPALHAALWGDPCERRPWIARSYLEKGKGGIRKGGTKEGRKDGDDGSDFDNNDADDDSRRC